MMKVEQIQLEIQTLSEQDFVRLRRWFLKQDWQHWDGRIESDAAAGKLGFLIEESVAANEQGMLLQERAKHGSREKLLAVLAKAPDVEPDEADRLPA